LGEKEKKDRHQQTKKRAEYVKKKYELLNKNNGTENLSIKLSLK
jgi:hypothetical protein